jgi:hypothetical protein
MVGEYQTSLSVRNTSSFSIWILIVTSPAPLITELDLIVSLMALKLVNAPRMVLVDVFGYSRVKDPVYVRVVIKFVI